MDIKFIVGSIINIIAILYFALIIIHKDLIFGIMSNCIKLHSGVLEAVAETCSNSIRDMIKYHNGIENFHIYLKEFAKDSPIHIISPFDMYFTESCGIKKLRIFNDAHSDEEICDGGLITATIESEDVFPIDIFNITHTRIIGFVMLDIHNVKDIEKRYQKLILRFFKNRDYSIFIADHTEQTITYIWNSEYGIVMGTLANKYNFTSFYDYLIENSKDVKDENKG